MRHPKLGASVHFHTDEEPEFKWNGRILSHDGRFTCVTIIPHILDFFFRDSDTIAKLIAELEKARAAMHESEEEERVKVMEAAGAEG